MGPTGDYETFCPFRQWSGAGNQSETTAGVTCAIAAAVVEWTAAVEPVLQRALDIRKSQEENLPSSIPRATPQKFHPKTLRLALLNGDTSVTRQLPRLRQYFSIKTKINRPTITNRLIQAQTLCGRTGGPARRRIVSCPPRSLSFRDIMMGDREGRHTELGQLGFSME